jgi:hypothetical protein
MEGLKIVALCVLAAVTYGIAHDQVTARLCVEYFTIGHPRILDTDSPTLLGLVWGVVATWWVGVMLGVPLAIAARVGAAHKVSASALVRPVCILVVVMSIVAVAAGLTGHSTATHDNGQLASIIAPRVPVDRRVAFMTALFAHNASYLSGFVGGVVLIIMVIVRRRHAWRQSMYFAPPSVH